MSQYFTNFSEYPDDTIPSGEWSESWHTDQVFTVRDGLSGPYFGDKYLEIHGISSTRGAFLWDTRGSGEVDVDQKIRFTPTGDSTFYNDNLGLVARVSGESSSETGYVIALNVYDNEYYLKKFVSASETLLKTVSKLIDIDSWYWLRFRVSGESLKVKLWDERMALEPPVDMAVACALYCAFYYDYILRG